MLPTPSPKAPPVDHEVEVRALAARDSLALLTEMLHRAYAPLAARGLNLTAATQHEIETRRRTLSGQTFVATCGRDLVGTVTVSSPLDVVPGSLPDMLPQYKDAQSARFHQFAVDPAWRGRGVGRQLVRQAEEWALARGYRTMTIDMAEGADELCGFYRSMGYRDVDLTQWPGKTYRSVVMQKVLDRSPLHGHLLMLARYNAWANDRLLDQVATLAEADYRRDLGLAFGSVHGTLNHLLVGEHHLWWPRIADGESPRLALDLELEPDRQRLAERLREGCARWPELLDRCSQERLDGSLSYTRLGGEAVTLPFAAVMSHVFNHGTHHRGQISAALTALGQAPPALDLIVMLQQEASAT